MNKYFEIKSKHHFPMLYTDLLSFTRLNILLFFTTAWLVLNIESEEIIFYIFMFFFALLLFTFFAIKEFYLIFQIHIVEEIKYDTEINNFLLQFKHKFKSKKNTLDIKDIIEIEKTKISKRHFLSNLCRVQSIFIHTKSETYVIFYNNEQIKEIDEIYNDLTQMLDKTVFFFLSLNT
jgi:hypothetical protein